MFTVHKMFKDGREKLSCSNKKKVLKISFPDIFNAMQTILFEDVLYLNCLFEFRDGKRSNASLKKLLSMIYILLINLVILILTACTLRR